MLGQYMRENSKTPGRTNRETEIRIFESGLDVRYDEYDRRYIGIMTNEGP